jgi:TolB-like protein
MIYRFGAFALDAERCELSHHGRIVAVEPQVFEVLHHLVRNRDHVVSRDELIAHVWDRRVVSDSTLSSRITAVRHAIGDSGAQQRLVRTFPRKGYRFVATVDEEMAFSAQKDPKLRAASGLNLDKPSIAVMAFANLSADAEVDRFADAIVDNLTCALSCFRQLRVFARSVGQSGAVNATREACENGVHYVVEGTLHKHGGQMRINVQLVSTSTATLLWASRFDGEVTDGFELQDRITATVASAIAAKIQQVDIERAKRLMPEVGASSCTLRGLRLLHRWTKEGIFGALELFRQSMEMDPEYAPAAAMASYCFVQRNSYGWLDDRGRDTAEGTMLGWRAAEAGKDDSLALANAALAISTLGGDLDGGAILAEQALRLNPHLALAWYVSGWMMIFRGKPEIAIEHLHRARLLGAHERLAFKIDAAAAYASFFSGRYDDALLSARNALGRRPNYLTALRVAGASHVLDGRVTEGQRAIAQVRQFDPALRVGGAMDLLPLRRMEDSQRWSDALHEAGLPA